MASYLPYQSRALHLGTCQGVPSKCICPGLSMWAVSPRADKIVEPGKWLLFPQHNGDKAWQVVKQQTENGTLGFAAKIAFEKSNSPAIMIYAANSDDKAALNNLKARINRVMQQAGLEQVQVKAQYKTDKMTQEGHYSVLAPASKFQGGVAPSNICKFFKTHCDRGDACQFLHLDAAGNDVRAGRGAGGTIPEVDCKICFSYFPETDGLFCRARDNPHFICLLCLNEFAKGELSGEHVNEGKLRCPCRGQVGAGGVVWCPADPWETETLALVLDPRTHAYLLANLHQTIARNEEIMKRQREQIAEVKKRNDTEQEELAKRMAEARALNDKAEKLRQMRQRIIDEVMYLRCPRCRTVFVDYDGCDALSCAQRGCGCHFCALCLEDCGSDAHKHVNEKHGSVFGPPHRFNDAHKDRRLGLLQTAFDSIAAEGRDFQNELLHTMKRDLQDIGIPSDNILRHGGMQRGQAQDATIARRDIRQIPPLPVQRVAARHFMAQRPDAPAERAVLAHEQGVQARLDGIDQHEFLIHLRQQYSVMVERDLTPHELRWDAENLQVEIFKLEG
jgi:hypothetical protein